MLTALDVVGRFARVVTDERDLGDGALLHGEVPERRILADLLTLLVLTPDRTPERGTHKKPMRSTKEHPGRHVFAAVVGVTYMRGHD